MDHDLLPIAEQTKTGDGQMSCKVSGGGGACHVRAPLMNVNGAQFVRPSDLEF